ncbi:MAG: tetratricopeptide repeat protein [Treponema sp.]|nr:tetratricopeptide repeat protein [Treponema sp.]
MYSRRAAFIIFRLAFFALLSVNLASCSQLPGKLRIIEGGFHHTGGRYAEAIDAYREARAYPEAAPYAEYGLGVIYLALDEDEAAINHFEAAALSLEDNGEFPPSEHRELRYRIHYNTGVIYFQRGDYAAAAAEFRQALETDGSHIEAKRNLELSLLSLDRRSRNETPLNEGTDKSGGEEILFDYMRQKEREKWRSREWTEDENPGPDY